MDPADDAVVRAIERGDAVLLTGAGFSRAMKDLDGDPLPVGAELAKSIWPIAFGNSEPFDPDTALSMVYAAANAKSPTLLHDQLKRHFIVDRESIPERYKTWFTLPWHRIYTLNIDDGDEASAEVDPSAKLQIVSALNTTPGAIQSDRLAVVHINGRLHDFPDVTFTTWEFADRTASFDPWYHEFVTDLSTRPVIVVGSVLDEPPLWHYMTLRGKRGSAKELRPRSWLVSPRLDVGRKLMLGSLNFEHIPETEKDFFDRVISPHRSRLSSANRWRETPAVGTGLHDVAEQVRAAKPGTSDFLLGRAPTWGDITNGFAATFEFDHEVTRAVDHLSSGTVAVVGSAGSGKTTSLMRAAGALAARGGTVLWLGRETELPVGSIRRAVRDSVPDYLFIDDLDRFGSDADALLRGLHRDSDSLIVVVGARSGRFYQLRYDERLTLERTLTQTRLTDGDAVALINQLERGHRLGALVGLTASERVEKITEHDDRQLLVTLIEATSGEKLHDKVAAECRSLVEAEQTLYGIACTSAWADNTPLSKQDILYAAHRRHEPNEALQAFRRLEQSGLLTASAGGLRARHRVVAESAIDYFRNEGQLATWITDLIFLVAAHYEIGRARRSRYGRLLIRLIDHQNLKKQVVSNEAVQRIYGAAESWLTRDPHFWLQRGSFETDYGELSAAQNFLHQARQLAPNDVLVDTAWAMLLLKRALVDPALPASAHDASEAFSLLYPIMENPESHSPHTFAVFLIFGLRWLREAPLGMEEKRQLRDDLRRLGKIGSYRHPRTADVQEGWEAAQRWLATNALV